jgi:hypothetical protein
MPEKKIAKVRVQVGPLSWVAWHRRTVHYTGGVYWRGKLVWTLTWWGLRT